ncbi:MAG TPA: M48 family metalloprotease [Rhodocyclaceae bacterium]
MKNASLLRPGLLIALAALSLAAFGQTSINLNSIFDAVKGVAKSQQVGSMSEADEIAAGKEIAAQMLGKYKIVHDEALQRYLNGVGLWVALQSDRPALPWRFAAVESNEINAFAVPGGAVLVTTGMLKLVANEAELACVFGHEVGHVVRKHHIALLQKDLLVQSGANLASSVQQGGGASAQAKQFLISQGSEIFSRSLDRGSERDADNDGVLLAARAGYDPGACLLFMKRMAGIKQGDNAIAALYKTHPQAADRAVDVGAAIESLQGIEPGTGLRPALAVSLRR